MQLREDRTTTILYKVKPTKRVRVPLPVRNLQVLVLVLVNSSNNNKQHPARKSNILIRNYIPRGILKAREQATVVKQRIIRGTSKIRAGINNSTSSIISTLLIAESPNQVIRSVRTGPFGIFRDSRLNNTLITAVETSWSSECINKHIGTLAFTAVSLLNTVEQITIYIKVLLIVLLDKNLSRRCLCI